MKKNILSLSEELISIESTAENPKGLSTILEMVLKKLNRYTIERFEKNGIQSALVYNTKNRPKKFKILFTSHLDVIPGKKYQYNPRVKGDRLYGAGALDMKSNAACLILVFKELADKLHYPLALQLVTDEESGGFNGTKYQIEKGVRADFVIAGETTNFDIVHKTKGILLAKVFCKGKTAHGAYPWRGENAILKMNKFLNALEKQYPSPKKEKWITTINVNKIETTNNAFNKIPDNCAVSLDIRYIPEDTETIVTNLKRLLPKGFVLTILENENPTLVRDTNTFIQSLKQSVEQNITKRISLRGANGTSDARHFIDVNCPGVEFGAVGGGIGSDNEWISIKSLEKYFSTLREFLLSFN